MHCKLNDLVSVPFTVHSIHCPTLYIKLCYVEHNTVSPAASGLQHVTPTFKFCSFPSALFICLLVIFFPMKQPNNASLKRQIFSLWVTQIKIFCPLLFSVHFLVSIISFARANMSKICEKYFWVCKKYFLMICTFNIKTKSRWEIE